MKLSITSSQLSEGIIIIDVSPQLSGQMRTKVNRLEFEVVNDVIRIKDIGNTQLTPTVKSGVTGFVFDEASKSLEIMNDRNLVHSVNTAQKTILIRVDFTTATITIFE